MDSADEVKMKQVATADDFRGKCCEPVCSGRVGRVGFFWQKMDGQMDEMTRLKWYLLAVNSNHE